MTGRLGNIVDKLLSTGVQQRAASTAVGAALGAMIGPIASSLTGDPKSDANTTARDMIAGALGGALGGMMNPLVGAGGGVAGGLISGLFDKEKKASVPGQDLRTPVMGGMRFPTQDSVESASRKLQQSSAEVGPQPAPLYSAMGRTKKAEIGDFMDPMMDDPLVLFLKKSAVEEEAKEQPPLTGLVEGSELEANLSNMPMGKEEFELTSSSPKPTKRMIPTTPDQGVEGYFSNARTMRKKLYEKDHPEGFDPGVVDRILGL